MLRRFLVIFFPLILFLSLLFGYSYYEGKKDYLNLLKTAENTVFNKLQKKIISNNFQHIVSDLLFFSEEHELLELLDGMEHFSSDDLAKDYRSFSLKQQVYDQIRFIDETGQEIIRVDYNEGSPLLASQENLQNQSSSDYFKQTISLKKGDIFISSFDLNMKDGVIEEPYKPMIRFATPVFDSSGKKRGIIIINFLGEVLLDNLHSMYGNSTREISLLNSEGYWLLSPIKENAWGFMFESTKNKTIGKLYPKIHEKVYQSERGQFPSEEGLVTFTTVYPIQELKRSLHGIGDTRGKVTSMSEEQYFWKVISLIPYSVIDRHNAQMYERYFALYLMLIILSALGSFYLVRVCSHRQETEDALNKSEKDLERAQALAHLGSWEWNIQKDEITWSNETYRIFGISKENGKPTLQTVEQAIAPEYREAHRREVQKAMGKTGIFDMEYSLYRPDGTKRIVFARGEATKNSEGKAISLFGTVQDITEQKKFEEALKQAHTKLEERVVARTAELASLNENLEKRVSEEIAKRRKQEQFMVQQSKMAAMGEMVSSIAHQWRQPLNSLGLLIQDIRDAYEYGELNEQYIHDTVEKSMGLIQFMSSTIDDFRNFFRPSKEKILFTVDDAIQSVLSLLSSQLLNHEIKIRIFCNGTEVKETIPDNECCDSKESNILGYPNEFKQVLVNIINNAREAIDEQKKEKAIKEKSLNGEICIKRSISDNSVILEIKDNAGGIAEDILNRVFEPYFTTKEEGKGTGIGLYMSKVIIEQNMGGTLTVRNGEKGAIFTVVLKKPDNSSSELQESL